MKKLSWAAAALASVYGGVTPAVELIDANTIEPEPLISMKVMLGDQAANSAAIDQLDEVLNRLDQTNDRAQEQADKASSLVLTKEPAREHLTAEFLTPPRNSESISYSMEDLKPVGVYATLPVLIAARGDAPFNDIQSLVEWSASREKPPILAHGGMATVPTLSAYRLAEEAGFHFKGKAFPRVDSRQLLDGDADLAIVSLPAVLSDIQSGVLKGIVAFTPGRMPALPNLKTVSEQGLSFDVSVWSGVFIPKATPEQVVRRLTAKLQQAPKAYALQKVSQTTALIVQEPGALPSKAQSELQFKSLHRLFSEHGYEKTALR